MIRPLNHAQQKTLLAMFIASALALAFFWPRFQASATVMAPDWSNVNMSYAGARWLAWQAGRLPHWTPEWYGGFPLLSHPELGHFYLPNLLLSWLSAWPGRSAVFDWFVIFNMVIGAAGGAFLARGLGFGVAASVVTGFAAIINGFGVTHFGHVAMVQVLGSGLWALGGLVRTIHRNHPMWSWITGLLFGQMILAGHPQMVLLLTYTALGAAVILALGTTSAHRVSTKIASLRGLIVFGVAAGSSAVQLIPSMTLMTQVERGTLSLSDALEHSVPVRHLPLLLTPWFGMLSHWILPPAERWVLNTSSWSPWGEWEWLLPIGTVLPFLAVVGYLARQNSQRVRWLALACGFLFVAATGAELYVFPWLWRIVPGFQATRIPARLLGPAYIGVAVLAGLGTDYLLNVSTISARQKILAGFTLSIGVLACVAWYFVDADKSRFPFISTWFTESTSGLGIPFEDVSTSALIQLAALATACFAMTALTITRQGKWKGYLVPALLFVELSLLLGHRNITVNASEVDTRQQPLFLALKQRPGRSMMAKSPTSPPGFAANFNSNTGLVSGAAMADGYNQLFLKGVQAISVSSTYLAPYYMDAVLDAWNVNTIVMPSQRVTSATLADGRTMGIVTLPSLRMERSQPVIQRPVPNIDPSRVHLSLSYAGDIASTASLRVTWKSMDGTESSSTLYCLGYDLVHAIDGPELSTKLPHYVSPGLAFDLRNWLLPLTVPAFARTSGTLVLEAPSEKPIEASTLLWETPAGDIYQRPLFMTPRSRLASYPNVPRHIIERKDVPGPALLFASAVKATDSDDLLQASRDLFSTTPLTQRPLLLWNKASLADSTGSSAASPFLGPAKLEPGARPEIMRALTDAPQPAWLFLSIPWYPGWTASIEGKPVAIERAWGAFMAIHVPQGPQTIELRFHTPGFTPALITSLLTLIVATFMAIRQGYCFSSFEQSGARTSSTR